MLITGESGTGKELVAQAIRKNSPRRSRRFVTINMAAVPDTLVESELFGHVKGSFTGAASGRTGRIEAADGGTLFIDEIGDLALPSQAKLLRVLEDYKVTQLVATKTHLSTCAWSPPRAATWSGWCARETSARTFTSVST